MITRRFAMIFGIVFLVVGVLGFVPGATVMHEHDSHLSVHGPGHGYLLGIFHVNVLHNIVHLLFGVLGVLSAATFVAAKNYFRVVGVSYLLLALLGMIPTGNTWNLWGLVPLHGSDVWLHLILGVVGAYFGFVAHAEDWGHRHYTHTAPR